MSIEVRIEKDDLNPMSEMGNRELTTWRGVKNKSLRARHITDRSILIDKKHIENQKLFNKLKERKSDETIENDKVKNLVSDLKDEKQWVANIRGQTTKTPGMNEDPKWTAIVSFRNYKEHRFVDGQKIQIVEKLFDGDLDMKAGERNILTWWKYGVPVGAVKLFDIHKPILK